jgi:hypothetical protein
MALRRCHCRSGWCCTSHSLMCASPAHPAAASLVYLQREVERKGSTLVYLYSSRTHSCLLVLNAQQILGLQSLHPKHTIVQLCSDSTCLDLMATTNPLAGNATYSCYKVLKSFLVPSEEEQGNYFQESVCSAALNGCAANHPLQLHSAC